MRLLRTLWLALLASLIPLTSGSLARAGPPAKTIGVFRVLAAPGDSLRIGLAWGAAGRAVGYRLTVLPTKTNGTWTGLPANLSVPATPTTHTFTAVNAAWDSVTFVATVESVDGIGPTGKTSTGQLALRRRAGAPGGVTWDTTATVTGIWVRPANDTIRLASNRILCAFKVFQSAAVAMRFADRAACDSIYRKYVPASARLVSAMEQLHADGACWTWASNMTAVPVTPLASCSAAARVDGLQLTLQRTRAVPDVLRYAVGGGP